MMISFALMFRFVLRSLCIVISITTGTGLHAQLSEQDSLRNVLVKQESDTNRVNTLLRLAWILRAENPTESMETALDAKALSERIRFDKGRGMALSTIGVLQYRKGDLVAATNTHMQALTIRKNIGDDNGVARTYINLGNIYSDQHNNALALEHYLGAMEILEGGGDDERLGIVYLNIGGIYLAMDKNTEAAAYCNRAAALGRKIQDPLLEAQAYNNAGVCFEHLGMIDSAMLAYKTSYDIANEQSEKVLMVDAAMNIGNMFRLKSQFDKAIEVHRAAEEIALEMGYVEGLRGIYECLSNDYRSKGDFKLAYDYHVMFKNYSDSIYNEENSIKMVEISSRFAQEKKEMESRKVQLELSTQESSDSSKRTLMISGVIVLLSLGTAILIVVNTNKAGKRDRLLQEAQEAEIIRLRNSANNRQTLNQ